MPKRRNEHNSNARWDSGGGERGFLLSLPLHDHHGDGRRGGWWERVGGGDRATVAAVTSTQSVERAHV